MSHDDEVRSDKKVVSGDGGPETSTAQIFLDQVAEDTLNPFKTLLRVLVRIVIGS